ncbi:MAG TPA: DUF4331 family protein [Planctomycetota bacterium]|nr:DUF4331 family protein [Planctomycetota bacterium]
MRHKRLVRPLAMLFLPVLLVMLTGADHRDAPGLQFDPASDINDVYAFVNANDNNVVLAMTVNPFTAPGLNPVFSSDTLYQFKIDQNGDGVEDLVIQITFDKPSGKSSNATQHFTLVGPVKPAKTGAINTLVKATTSITGPIDNTVAGNFVTDSSGIKVFAGARDDPFFFDFIAFVNGNQYRNPGVDFFAGMNVSVIAVELPASMLTKGGNSINIWGTTSLPSSDKRAIKAAAKGDIPVLEEGPVKTFVQFDRMGRPAINTVLINPEHKDAFNAAVPSEDKALFRNDVVAHILALNGGDQAHANTTADVLMPDVLTLDVTKTAGFNAALNGRRPEDDVIDAELNILTKGAVKGDNVNANDVPFLTDFPFFAPPHQAHEGVPARN